MVNSDNRLRLIAICILACVTDTILNGVGAIRRREPVVDVVGIRRVVIHPHSAAIIVLVKTSCVVSDRQAMVNEYLMVRTLTAHLEAVAVALTRISVQRDSNRIAIAVGHLCAYFAVEPRFVGRQSPRMLSHVIIRRAILITDAVLNNGI